MVDRQLSPGWATYIRVSDEDKQSPERSFAMQRQRIQEQLLTPSDVPFKQEYRDKLTGTNPNRTHYLQMLADAESGLFSHLGLYRADRFGRNAAEGLQAANKLIGLGVKLRVANMPSLTPETPDGFFMFLIQMGLAQREVDVLRQRTGDGMKAKLRAGGWAHKAPEGYLNKERLVKSGKYERWVEQDPNQIKMIRDAWDLLLTDRYTLTNICEELTARGHVRRSGRPWAWTDPRTGKRKQAKNQLQRIFHNPFYAGWVTSKRFAIANGEVRGNWEPVITTRELERGIEILRRHYRDKPRQSRRFYLLRNLLWVEFGGRRYKMYGSTPSGRLLSYLYYRTNPRPNGKTVRISCKVVDAQIPGLLQSITVAPEDVPRIREVYRSHITQVTDSDRSAKKEKLSRRVSQLREEEAHLARLLIKGKISEETYDRLRLEWLEKLTHAQIGIQDLERDADRCFDDLEAGLSLLSKAYLFFGRLKEIERNSLLQILLNRIIVDAKGQIKAHELHSPFAYLRRLVEASKKPNSSGSGSRWVTLGTPTVTRTPPKTSR